MPCPAYLGVLLGVALATVLPCYYCYYLEAEVIYDIGSILVGVHAVALVAAYYLVVVLELGAYLVYPLSSAYCLVYLCGILGWVLSVCAVSPLVDYAWCVLYVAA